MSSVQAPGERPGVWQSIGDAIRRIRALEAIPLGVQEITSDDNSVTVVDGDGPITDLSVATDGIRFDFDNEGGYLDVKANDTDADGYGIHFNDDTSDNGSLYEAEQSLLLRRQDGTSSILIGDGFSGLTIHTLAQLLLDVATLTIAAATTVDGGANVATNFADGIAPTDLATVEQITGAVVDAIMYAVANSGTYLDITTTATGGGGIGVAIHDTDPGSNGIALTSDAGGIDLLANGAQVQLLSGGTTFRVDSLGAISAFLAAGASFTLFDSSANPILQMTEGDPNLYIPVGGTVVASL